MSTSKQALRMKRRRELEKSVREDTFDEEVTRLAQHDDRSADTDEPSTSMAHSVSYFGEGSSDLYQSQDMEVPDAAAALDVGDDIGQSDHSVSHFGEGPSDLYQSQDMEVTDAAAALDVGDDSGQSEVTGQEPARDDHCLLFCTSDSAISDSDNSTRNSDNIGDSDELVEGGSPGVDTLRSDLVQWSLKHNITHVAIDDFLTILKRNGHDSLPSTATALLRTPRRPGKWIVELGSGEYWYHGVLNALHDTFELEMSSSVDNENAIVLDVFIDGLTPYKVPSKKTSLWPIAARIISEKVKTKPFVVALWCGGKKEPDDLGGFLGPFVDECEKLMSGFVLNGLSYKLMIRNIIAHAPARAWLKQVNPHNSKVSCERCLIRGDWFSNRIVFDTDVQCAPRTDESFKNRSDPEYHIDSSPLEKIVNMISQFPLDRLHLVDLGATRRFLKMLYDRKGSVMKLKAATINTLDLYAKALSAFFPSEFNRKPRALSAWHNFKGTELKRFLHYDGILMFQKLAELLPDYQSVYECFLLLSCAIRILSDPNLCELYADDAAYLLDNFVRFGARVFGKHFVVYNIHHCIHLTDDCKKHGVLDNFSAEMYESALGQMKALLRAQGRVLPQLIARTLELQHKIFKNDATNTENAARLSFPHDSGPSGELMGQKFKNCEYKFTIRVSSENDTCCLTVNKEVIIVENVVRCEDGEVYFVGRNFEKVTSFFEYPTDSTSLGIFKVKGLALRVSQWNVKSEIVRKCVLLPINLNNVKKQNLNSDCYLAIRPAERRPRHLAATSEARGRWDVFNHSGHVWRGGGGGRG